MVTESDKKRQTILDILKETRYCCEYKKQFPPMITRQKFADQWSRICLKAREELNNNNGYQSNILLFSLDQADSFRDLSFMADAMNTDPLFIQTVRKLSGKTPYLQAIQTADQNQLYLRLS